MDSTGPRDVLADLGPGIAATVARVGGQDAARLRYMQSTELVPGDSIEKVERAPFEVPVRVLGQD